MSNFHKVILDLFGGTGAWSRPYAEAGYDVRVITLPGHDARRWNDYLTLRVHGVLAAPPCTYFSRMRMCRGKPTPEQFLEGLSCVDASMRIISVVKPVWWALENPQGYLKRWLGEPQMKFDPCDFGDPWTKRTWLWGNFTPPMMRGAVEPTAPWLSSRTGHPRGRKGIGHGNAELRAKTPEGFARAFFEANP